MGILFTYLINYIVVMFMCTLHVTRHVQSYIELSGFLKVAQSNAPLENKPIGLQKRDWCVGGVTLRDRRHKHNMLRITQLNIA